MIMTVNLIYLTGLRVILTLNFDRYGTQYNLNKAAVVVERLSLVCLLTYILR